VIYEVDFESVTRRSGVYEHEVIRNLQPKSDQVNGPERQGGLGHGMMDMCANVNKTHHTISSESGCTLLLNRL